MIVDIYKVGGMFAPRDSEKAIKIVANEQEMDNFIQEAKTVLSQYEPPCSDFIKYITTSWKEYEPYTEEEKQEFKNKKAFILKLYERNLFDLVWTWILLLVSNYNSVLKNIIREKRKESEYLNEKIKKMSD